MNRVIENKVEMGSDQFQKMTFLYNAIQDGWTVKKKKEKQTDSYVFTKKHEGKREVFLDTYLETFVRTSLNMNHLLENSNPTA